MEFKPFVGFMAGSLHLPCKVETPTELGENEKTEMDMDHVVNVLKQIRDEYTASAARMEKIVEKFGTLEQLSGSAKQVLYDTAEMLQASVVDVSPTDFLLEQTKLALEESKLSKKKLQFQNNIHKLSRRNSSLKQRTEELLRDIQVAKKEYSESKETMERKSVETQFIELQVEKYKKELEKLKEEEKLLGLIDPEQFKAVQERVEAIAQIKAERDILKLKLEKYAGLPPNLEQAQKVLAQTIHNYEELDKHMKARILNQTERATDMMSVPLQHPAWKLK